MTVDTKALPGQLPVTAAELSYGHEEKKRGAIFTRHSVVDFMLDLIGYEVTQPLHKKSLLEPSFGTGRFVLAAVARLVESWRNHTEGTDHTLLLDAIRAVELDSESYLLFRAELDTYLRAAGFSEAEAGDLLGAWLIHDDYLSVTLEAFDYVIGNPPYVRQELIEPHLLAAYRAQFKTMIGRADLYVAFFERSLDLLKDGGRLSFICSDAWVKNDYGRALRKKIAKDFHLHTHVDLYGVDAFEVSVGAYPSITVIERGPASPTRVARAESADTAHLTDLLDALNRPEPAMSGPRVLSLKDVVDGTNPWLLSMHGSVLIIRDLEARFPTLEQAGCRIGIGVATGADKAFIGHFADLDVEDDRKLPLATNKDVPGGQVKWTGKGIINPYRDEGGLVDLADYPRLARHLERFRPVLEARHTAKATVPSRWFKTIDRITPELTWEEKLLIPDIKGNGDAITYDPGTLYPHHNLYFITSATWNLRALQALLRSGIAHMFVDAYSVKIGGGYLRFQAQNLRRIRVPHWNDIQVEDREAMVLAGEAGLKLDSSLLERIYALNAGTLAFIDGGTK